MRCSLRTHYRAAAADDDAALRAVAELAAAFVPSKERFLETTAQGRAFLDATRAAWPCPAMTRLDNAWDGPVALPVAVGVACAGHDIALSGRAARLPACARRQLDFRRRPAHPARPDRRPARARRARADGRRPPRRAPWRRHSTRSAPAPSAPISRACATRRNTRGCSEAENRDGSCTRSPARRCRRPGRLGQDGADGCAVQAAARPLRDRGDHQRHLHQVGRRISGALRRARARAHRRRRDRRLSAHRHPRGRFRQSRGHRRHAAEIPDA